MSNHWIPKVKKCVNCGGNFKRVSRSYHNEKKPYEGNMICYRQKENKEYEQILKVGEYDELVQGKYLRSSWSYVLWDGESLRHEGGYFCSGKCSKEFARECAEQGVRRLGQSLVRFNKGDRRAS